MMERARGYGLVIVLCIAAGLILIAARTRVLPDPYNPLAPLDLAEAPNLMTNAKLWMMAGDTPACLAALRKAGVAVTPMLERTDRPGCTRKGTVMVARLSRAEIVPAEMGCNIVLRLYLLERHDIQPLARRYFGSEVGRITHFGSYSCRTMRGSSRMSEHATANAFDISGFKLANGRMVSLKRDWNAAGPPAPFLRDLRTRACLLFNMVLSPDYNTGHADHFHVDMGWLMGCH